MQFCLQTPVHFIRCYLADRVTVTPTKLAQPKDQKCTARLGDYCTALSLSLCVCVRARVCVCVCECVCVCVCVCVIQLALGEQENYIVELMEINVPCRGIVSTIHLSFNRKSGTSPPHNTQLVIANCSVSANVNIAKITVIRLFLLSDSD
jgi:hypothetical protein